MPTEDQPLLHPRRPALLAGSAAVAGCALAKVAAVLPTVGWITLILGIALAIAASMIARKHRSLSSAIAACLAVTAMFAGYAIVSSTPPPHSLANELQDGADLVRIEGVVIEGGDYVQRDPAAFEYPDSPQSESEFPVSTDPRRNISYLLEVDRLPDLDRNSTGRIKLYAPPGTNLELYSRVSVVGKLRQPRRAGNPGEVDSRERYAQHGVSHTLTINQLGQIEVLEPPAGWDVRRLAPWVHEQFHKHIGSRIPRDRAAILGATLLGERGNLSADQRAKFVRSGTVHLLVVSGLHVGLLVGAVMLILRAFGIDPRKAWAVAGVVALTYLFVTGMQPSVLRATIMVVIYALGKVLLRRPDPLNVLGASALVSLIINPGDVAELGFQLSYLAVLGILVLGPALQMRRKLTDSERAVRNGRERTLDWLGASLRISLAVGLCTWPLLAYSVHIVSPAMFLTNLVVAPLLTAMLGVALLAPLAFIPPVGAALAWILSLLAGALDLLASVFADIPGGHLFLAAPPLWWLLGYYAMIFVAVRAPRWGLPRFAGAAVWLIWLTLIPAGDLIGGDTPGPARLTALDVGQGQCVVIEIPNGPCAVLDCGSTSLGGVGERVLAPYLWSRGRSRIDVLFISHADADHVNGLPQLFERFEVGHVYVSAIFADDAEGRALTDWLEDRANVSVLRRGDTVALADGLELRCLGPDPGFVTGLLNEREHRNEGSLILELQAGPTRVLLPSDAETPGLAGAGNLREPQADIVFAPHQGSAVENLNALLNRWKPKHIVISARDSFPAESSLNAYGDSGAEVWKTWQHGAVTFELSADGEIIVASYR